MVHQGFLRSWQHNGLCARVLDLVGELAAHMQAEGRTAKVFITGQGFRPHASSERCSRFLLTVTSAPADSECDCLRAGHSLGGALATLAAYDLKSRFRRLPVHVYTFGAPRTGNKAFARWTFSLCKPYYS